MTCKFCLRTLARSLYQIGFLHRTEMAHYYFQVERRVVSQLALAYEKQLITDGCSLHLTVDNVNSDQELTKTEHSSSSDRSNPPAIKLQVVTRGKTTDLELDGVATNLF